MEHRTVADPVLKVISWVGSGCRSMAANCHSLPTLLVRLALLRHRLPFSKHLPNWCTDHARPLHRRRPWWDDRGSRKVPWRGGIRPGTRPM